MPFGYTDPFRRQTTVSMQPANAITRSFPYGMLALVGAVGTIASPTNALAWGVEGHEVVAAIARGYLTPQVREKVDKMLAADTDPLAKHEMLDEAVWADRYRVSHKETFEWHFVDLELDRPDLKAACFDFPPAEPASKGPAHDCIVNKTSEFTKELANPATPADERLLALKFVLHFVGDIHQPLHDSDNHDKGGNCVLLSLGGQRTVNMHSYWDTTVVDGLGDDNPRTLASKLAANITPANKAAWEQGDAQTWALEGFQVTKTVIYSVDAKPGCGSDKSPVSLPAGYEEKAREVAAVQLEKAGVRLAALLNHALTP
jgi:hypothetical protein